MLQRRSRISDIGKLLRYGLYFSVAASSIIIIAGMDVAALWHLSVLSISPNLLLISTCAVSLVYGPMTGVAYGSALALVEDLAVGAAPGASIVPVVVSALFWESVGRRMFRDNPLTWILLCVSATFAFDLAYYLMLAVYGRFPGFTWSPLRSTLIGAVCNGLVSPLVFIPVYRVYRISHAD